MKEEKFLISTETEGLTRHEVWDTTTPLGIGSPFRWVLEKTSTGVRVRDLRGLNHKVQTHASKEFESKDLLNGVECDLDEMKLEIRPTRVVRPAYLTDAPLDPGKELREVMVYAGARGIILDARKMGTSYVGYLRGDPAFQATKNATGVMVKPLQDGLFLKTDEQKPELGTAGRPWTLTTEQMREAVVFYQSNWWRFHVTAAAEVVTVPATVNADAEAEWLKKIGKRMAIAVFLLLLLIWIIPSTPKEEEEVAQAPVVKLTPHIGGSMTAAASGSAGPLIAPDTEAPPAPAANSESQVATLKSLFSGATSLAQHVVGSAPTTSNSAVTTAKAVNVNPVTNVKPIDGGGTSKVATLGGGGGTGTHGLGYGSGEQGKVVGGSSGLATFDGEGAEVEEGLTKEEVGKVIHDHGSEVRYCQEASLVVNPKSEGKLVLQFKINPHGIVDAVSIKTSDLTEKGLGECVMRRLKTWKFPNPKGGVFVNISYPFVFKTLERN